MPNRLGLAYVAGKLIVGSDLTVKAIQTDKAKLVILASDASDNTTKKIMDKTKYYGITCVNTFDSKTISKAIGKNNIKVVAITEEGFAKMYK